MSSAYGRWILNHWTSREVLRAAVFNLFGTKDQFRGRQFFHGSAGGDGGWGDGSGGNGGDGERQMWLCLLAAMHLLLCSLIPNRPWTGTSPHPGDWGPALDCFFPWQELMFYVVAEQTKMALSENPVFPCPFLLCAGVAVLVKQRGGSCTVGELSVLWVEERGSCWMRRDHGEPWMGGRML